MTKVIFCLQTEYVRLILPGKSTKPNCYDKLVLEGVTAISTSWIKTLLVEVQLSGYSKSLHISGPFLLNRNRSFADQKKFFVFFLGLSRKKNPIFTRWTPQIGVKFSSDIQESSRRRKKWKKEGTRNRCCVSVTDKHSLCIKKPSTVRTIVSTQQSGENG